MRAMASAPFTLTTSLCLLALTAGLTGCGSREAARKNPEAFSQDTPYTTRVTGRGEDVCWSVKRAFLTQGYMLDRGADTLVMSGTKESQPDEDTNVSLRLQATCVDNRDGSSTVFATATRETSKVQRVGHSSTVGAWVATLSLPSGTDRRLSVQKRETIQDPKFYESFYVLVQRFANEETRQGRQQQSEGKR